VYVDIEVTGQAGEPLATHRLTAIVRGATVASPAGTGPPGQVPPEQAARGPGGGRTVQLAVKVDSGQPLRYAEVTGDRNAVHIDPAAARAAGFDGVIAHGLGVLGLATSALVTAFAPAAPERLARIRARFTAPVAAGQALTIAAAEHANGVGFEARTAAGAPALRGGWAVFRPGTAKEVTVQR
jgi:acyl dehydratase